MESRRGGSLSGLDWSQPWARPWQPWGEPVARHVAAGAPLHAALEAAPGAPLRFVPQDALPAGVPYERYIFESGCCPVREGWHDFFNGVCWLGLPLSKRRLNALQAGQLALRGSSGPRGPVRDAITVFDENGALLQAPPAVWDALLQRQWRRAFVDLRSLWAQARLLVVGHALLEQLATAPRKGLTAHVWRADAPLAGVAEADAWLAGQLEDATLAAKPFTPLPVLGIPGWCAANENFAFYDDSQVFRPARALT